MTVKKALEILDYFIEKKLEFQNGLIQPEKPWNSKNMIVSQMVEQISDNIKTDLIFLKLLKKQLKPNCNHPKKLHDRSGGILYCMGCNLDL